MDSSSVSWANSTLAAAEAYAEDQANQAANERASAQARVEAQVAAGGAVDEVVPPTAQQMAEDAFWGKDPNRPTAAPPGQSAGSSNSSGAGERLGLTPEQVAEFTKFGIPMERDSEGNYYLSVAPQSVQITQPPEPTYGKDLPPEGATSSNVAAPPQQTAPPGETAPAGVAAAEGPAPVATKPAPEAEKAVKTGLGADVDKLVNGSPSLQKTWNALKAKGWQVEFGDAGKGSYCAAGRKTVVFDKNLASDPKELTQVFSHEAGHAGHSKPAPIPPSGLTKAEYLQKNLDRHLTDEGAANFENARARDEIKSATGDDIGINGVQDESYQRIYDSYKDGKITEAEAKYQMGQAFADGEKTSTTNQSYRDYYTATYEKTWNDSYSSLPPGDRAP